MTTKRPKNSKTNPGSKSGLWARSVIVGGCLVLTACSVSAPLAVRSTTGLAPAQPAQIALSLPDEGGETLKGQFADALQQSLSGRGIAAPEAALIADYAISMGPAEIGVQQPQDEAEPLERDPDWIAPPRPARRFDECKAQELRGTLLVLDRSSGAVTYRGQGTVVECEFGDAEIAELADGLVADYLSKSGN